jgi:23S rRNA pseudouridine1911/1915/1917 synthase
MIDTIDTRVSTGQISGTSTGDSPVTPIEVLYEDNDLLVVNKPAGMVVNRAQSVKELTVQDWAEQYFANQKEGISQAQQEGEPDWQSLVPASYPTEFGTPEEIFNQRSGICHRLDRETSGALLIAKNPGALLHILQQFQERTIQKRYLCLTHGRFNLEEGEIDLPLARRSRNRKLFGIDAEGRPALTRYKVLQYFTTLDQDAIADQVQQVGGPAPAQLKQLNNKQLYSGFSLVHCWPKTGRTHQIRVHLTHLQHPLVADPQYVGKKRFKLDRLWCPRQFLHAEEIILLHPRLGETLAVTAPLTPDLTAVLRLLSTDG